MKVRLISVGKPRDPELVSLHDRYAERIRRLGVDYRTRHVADVRAGGRYSDDEVRRREAQAVEETFSGRGFVVALDLAGRTLDSEAFARHLERWAVPRVRFVIGGPLGLDRGFVRSAGWSWSLSPLTLPHELVRVVLAEQIYRALTILRGSPYHK